MEKGLISLDDDVREVVPAFNDLKVLVGFEGEDIDKTVTSTDVTLQSGSRNPSFQCSQSMPQVKTIYKDI